MSVAALAILIRRRSPLRPLEPAGHDDKPLPRRPIFHEPELSRGIPDRRYGEVASPECSMRHRLRSLRGLRPPRKKTSRMSASATTPVEFERLTEQPLAYLAREVPVAGRIQRGVRLLLIIDATPASARHGQADVFVPQFLLECAHRSSMCESQRAPVSENVGASENH